MTTASTVTTWALADAYTEAQTFKKTSLPRSTPSVSASS